MGVHHWTFLVLIHLFCVAGLAITPSDPKVDAVREERADVALPDVPPMALAKRGGAKVGLAWSNGEDNHLYQYVTSKVQFLYTWSAYCPTQASGLGLNCARMLWGPSGSRLSSFQKLRTSPGTTILMGMNEVNEPSQANMNVGAGVALWNAEIRPWGNKGYTLVSPSVTNSPSGIAWLNGFFAQCGGNDNCGVAILAVHFYGTSINNFKAWVTKCYQTFGLPIWVTEFACQSFSGGPQCSRSQVWYFMAEVTAWMDEQPYVYAYFAFGLMHDMRGVNPLNQLMKADGSPTDLGYFYINA